MPRRVLSASTFFPRGGSAHVLRALARELPAHGWEVTVLSGSRHDAGAQGDARRFYRGLDVREVDFTPALSAPDPLDPPAGAAPMHPSFEDRDGAPDRVFAALDDAAFERQVRAWAEALERAGAARFDALHLHHLTPLHEAAARIAPDVPVVGHLHGTELLMLERIERGAPSGWAHAGAWRQRMRRWAQGCARLVLLSESQRERAQGLLDVDPEKCTVVPNGYDPSLFSPPDRTVDRLATWRRVLVDEPRGWRPGEGAGSVRYSAEEVAILERSPVLLYVGRFTEVKRIGLLVQAHARATERYGQPVALVLVGGHPGEWEGEHPWEAVQRTGAPNVFLAGWHDHDDLPELLHASDVLVLPSVREQFGQVIVEAMACGVPPIAVDRYGPAGIVRDGETGWLVEPDDEEALTGALVAAATDPAERERRCEAALVDARERFSWPALAGEMATVLEAAREGR